MLRTSPPGRISHLADQMAVQQRRQLADRRIAARGRAAVEQQAVRQHGQLSSRSARCGGDVTWTMRPSVAEIAGWPSRIEDDRASCRLACAREVDQSRGIFRSKRRGAVGGHQRLVARPPRRGRAAAQRSPAATLTTIARGCDMRRPTPAWLQQSRAPIAAPPALSVERSDTWDMDSRSILPAAHARRRHHPEETRRRRAGPRRDRASSSRASPTARCPTIRRRRC